MKLEPANTVCPKCGNGNYMYHLIGKNVGRLNMKCINCNSYFEFNELYKQKIAKVVKPQTNADRIRAMTDEELAEKWWKLLDCGECPARPNCSLLHKDCVQFALDWLKKEADK